MFILFFLVPIALLCLVLFIGIKNLMQKKYHGFKKFLVILGLIFLVFWLIIFLWGIYWMNGLNMAGR